MDVSIQFFSVFGKATQILWYISEKTIMNLFKSMCSQKISIMNRLMCLKKVKVGKIKKQKNSLTPYKSMV